MAIDTTRYPRNKKVEEIKQVEEPIKTQDISAKKADESIALSKDEEKKDHDGDGLTNREEDAYGTHRDSFDTDGDGHGDGHEINNGTNPLVHDMIRAGDIEGLRSSLKEYSDPAVNLITLRALSRLDKTNRNDYIEQMGDILKNYPSLNQISANPTNPTNTIAEKILGKTQISKPPKGLDVTMKLSENEQ